MFSILARTIPRRALAQPVRFMAQKPPSKNLKSKPQPTHIPETKKTPAEAPQAAPEAAPETTPEPTLEQAPTPSSAVPSLDFSPPEPEERTKTTGAKSSKGSLSTNERKRRFMSRVLLAVLGLGFATQVIYMGREWEEDELKNKKIVRGRVYFFADMPPDC